MSKQSKQARKAERSQRVRELAMLLPAFSFMFGNLEKLEESDKQDKDYELTIRITTKLARVIKRYVKLQPDALKLWNSCEETIGEDKYNVFLLGLMLLGQHEEFERRLIPLYMLEDIVDLQDLCMPHFENEEVSKTIDYVWKVQEYILGQNV